jgi:transcriptional regulator with XRE-family HTH domain
VDSDNVRVDGLYDTAYRAAMPIYLRLRELRQALGLTQTELAARAGVRRATLSRLENGRVSAINLAVLEKLADRLNVEPGFLLSRSPSRNAAK